MIKKWTEVPTKNSVKDELTIFFELLRCGQLDQAKDSIAHHSNDWDYQLWVLWQSTYLLMLEEMGQEIDDESFEGQGWLIDLDWLSDLGVEETVHWEFPEAFVHPDGEHFFVNLMYQGEILDVSGDFRVIKDGNEYYLMRVIIHSA